MWYIGARLHKEINGKDEHTTTNSDRLVRLPMYYNIDKCDLEKVINKVLEFFSI